MAHATLDDAPRILGDFGGVQFSLEISGTIAMTATTSRRPKARRAIADTGPLSRTTAYGREVLRVLKEMQKLGPWELGPRISDRIFKK